ncbi:MAG TPA: hypothetical protein VJ692_14665 [Nitrospiraceae bacterium]|nr:hypothetical protein [Nitrospiraceae bacterium]
MRHQSHEDRTEGCAGTGKRGGNRSADRREARFKSDVAAIEAAGDLTETLETVSLKPTKSNIAVKLVALAWTPYWQDAAGKATPAWN